MSVFTNKALSAFALILCFALLFCLILKKPFFERMEQKRLYREAKNELARLEEKETELKNEISFYSSRKGLKYIAKKHGFYDDDDILIIVTDNKVTEQPKDRDKENR